MKGIIISCLLFFVGHILIWYQLNGQFIWEFFKKNTFLVAIIGVPASVLFIWATRWAVDSFDGVFWPARFVGFAVGVLVYGVMVSYYFNEGINLKTAVTLFLALCILLIQVLWK